MLQQLTPHAQLNLSPLLTHTVVLDTAKETPGCGDQAQRIHQLLDMHLVDSM